MPENPLSDNTAAGQLGGYLYQVELALLRLLELEEGESLWVEALDDFHVEGGDLDPELSQVKHHMGDRPPRLTDGSRDLWKTLAIWAKAISELGDDLNVSQFVLLTNSEVPQGSIADKIQNDQDYTATSQAIRAKSAPGDPDVLKHFSVVQGLTERQLINLISRTRIIGGVPKLSETKLRWKRVLRSKSFHDDTHDQAIQSLRGWFATELYTRLKSEGGAKFSEDEMHLEVCSLRDSLTRDVLPHYDEAQLGNIPSQSEVSDSVFIRQLVYLRASSREQSRATSDCFFARSTRSRWIEEGKLNPKRLNEYDKTLAYHWQQKFDWLLDDTEGVDEEDVLVKKGTIHYREMQSIEVPINASQCFPFLSKGSYHMLADETRVGWHPKFQELLERDGIRGKA